MPEELGYSDPEEALGAEFWTQPREALETAYALIYAQVAAVLRDEYRERGGSAIDLLVIERLAAIYSRIRMREANPRENLTERERRDMNKEFIDFALTIKKLWNAQDDKDVATTVKHRIDSAIQEAFKKLTPDEAAKLGGALLDAFAEKGL